MIFGCSVLLNPEIASYTQIPDVKGRSAETAGQSRRLGNPNCLVYVMSLQHQIQVI